MNKGLSPLVAVVILIVIVISIGTLVTGWVTTFTRQSQETVTNRTTSSVDCTGASVTIRSVFLNNGTSGSATVIVENTGFVDGLTITSAQILNMTGGNFSSPVVPIYGFSRGDIVSLPFYNISVPTCAYFSEALLATSCGGVSDSYKQPPEGC